MSERRDGPFYHGTLDKIPAGFVLDPSGAAESGTRWVGTDQRYMYYTDWAQHAAAYARLPFYAMRGTVGHVYEVQPLGTDWQPVTEHELDPDSRTRREHSFRTAGGLRVIRELGPDDVGGHGKLISSRNWEAMGHAPDAPPLVAS